MGTGRASRALSCVETRMAEVVGVKEIERDGLSSYCPTSHGTVSSSSRTVVEEASEEGGRRSGSSRSEGGARRSREARERRLGFFGPVWHVSGQLRLRLTDHCRNTVARSRFSLSCFLLSL